MRAQCRDNVGAWSIGPEAGLGVVGGWVGGLGHCEDQTGTCNISKEDSGQIEQRYSLLLSTDGVKGNESENSEFNRAEN